MTLSCGFRELKFSSTYIHWECSNAVFVVQLICKVFLDWLPKEPWKVYSEVLHSIGKITEFQGILLDYLTGEC